MAIERGKSGSETKQLAERIDRSYYHRTDGFLRWKRILAAVAILAGIAWCAWGAFDQERHYSPGPVASAHSLWENNCEACHLPFTPIRSDTWLSSAESQKLLDAKCMSCHAGPAHHSFQKPEEVASCATCHSEHHGRDASLVRTADRHCTSCHANLNEHRQLPEEHSQPLPSNVASITRFDRDHPDFKLPEDDPGHLKFSHRRHMALGLNGGAADRYPARTWKYLPVTYRDRYQPAGTKEDDPIQLNCASCHQFDVSDANKKLAGLPSAVFPQRTSGAYSLPIVYENHCAACHPLTYEPQVATDTEQGIVAQLPDNPQTVPHRLRGEKMQEFLEAVYAQKLLQQDPQLLNIPVTPTSPLPAVEVAEGLETIGTAIKERVRTAARALGERCAECHVINPLPNDHASPEEEPLWLSMLPTNVPQIWMPQAKFNHAPHRAMSCQECHSVSENPAADLQQTGSWRDGDRVLLPQRSLCIKCHAPQSEIASAGARFDCVECHNYHNLDHPLAGLGAAARGVPKEQDRTLLELLRDQPPKAEVSLPVHP